MNALITTPDLPSILTPEKLIEYLTQHQDFVYSTTSMVKDPLASFLAHEGYTVQVGHQETEFCLGPADYRVVVNPVWIRDYSHALYEYSAITTQGTKGTYEVTGEKALEILQDVLNELTNHIIVVLSQP